MEDLRLLILNFNNDAKVIGALDSEDKVQRFEQVMD